jgi:phosphatidylglycerophosphate synthase
LRLAAILGAAALLTDIPREWLLLLFGANVALDVADGYTARRTAQVTQLGTMFDREADAVFVLVAYLYFFCVADVGAWILLPGLLPYLYRLFVRAVRAAPADQTKERLAAVLAGANYVFLLLAVAVPPPVQASVLAVSTAIVLVSFGISFWKVYRDEHSLP